MWKNIDYSVEGHTRQKEKEVIINALVTFDFARRILSKFQEQKYVTRNKVTIVKNRDFGI